MSCTALYAYVTNMTGLDLDRIANATNVPAPAIQAALSRESQGRAPLEITNMVASRLASAAHAVMVHWYEDDVPNADEYHRECVLREITDDVDSLGLEELLVEQFGGDAVGEYGGPVGFVAAVAGADDWGAEKAYRWPTVH